MDAPVGILLIFHCIIALSVSLYFAAYPAVVEALALCSAGSWCQLNTSVIRQSLGVPMDAVSVPAWVHDELACSVVELFHKHSTPDHVAVLRPLLYDLSVQLVALHWHSPRREQ